MLVELVKDGYDTNYIISRFKCQANILVIVHSQVYDDEERIEEKG
jgi:hypothetical protein